MEAEYRLFPVDDVPASEWTLSDIAVLLNCAGQFMRTAEPHRCRGCQRRRISCDKKIPPFLFFEL
jgi:short subunit dehydrogenase-like uncharacterized protein